MENKINSLYGRASHIGQAIYPIVFCRLIGFMNNIADGEEKEEIAKAYWLGEGDFLKPIKREHILQILFEDKKIMSYLCSDVKRELESLIGQLPHHNIFVMQRMRRILNSLSSVEKLKVSEELSNCLVLPAEILEAGEELVVKTFKISERRISVVIKRVEKEITTNFKIGTLVAVHAGIARQQIEENTAKRLIYFVSSEYSLSKIGEPEKVPLFFFCRDFIQ